MDRAQREQMLNHLTVVNSYSQLIERAVKGCGNCDKIPVWTERIQRASSEMAAMIRTGLVGRA